MTGDEVKSELVVSIGDTIAEVATRSSYPLNTRILTDEDLSAADTPVRLRYGGPNGISFQTRTVAINSVATLVTGIEAAPQFDFVGRRAVPELYEAIDRRLRAARWEPIARAGITDPDELARQMADEGRPEVTAWQVGAYMNGETALTLRVRRLHAASVAFPDGAYLLNLVWRNEKIRAAAEAAVDVLRKEDGVSAIEPRPVEAASYGMRVRRLVPR